MKKVLSLVLAIVLSLFMMTSVSANIEKPEIIDGKEKVKIYLFRGEGCPHCVEFIKYFSTRYKEYENYFEIYSLESWKNTDNAILKEKIDEYFEISEDKRGVPLIVIGDDHIGGFGNGTGERVIAKALEQYKNENYKDVVATKIEKETTNTNYKIDDFKTTMSSEGISATDHSKDAIIILGILGAAVVTIIVLAVVSSKRK